MHAGLKKNLLDSSHQGEQGCSEILCSIAKIYKNLLACGSPSF